MLIIGIAGGSGSGKTTVVNSIINQFAPDQVLVIPQDAYYRDQSGLSEDEKKRINFDHPSSIEFSLLVAQLKELLAGRSVEMPMYSYVTCSRAKETITIKKKTGKGDCGRRDPDLHA
jgi:uridine kinase